jgi:ATP-binding protein involved in chromosome partitioning
MDVDVYGPSVPRLLGIAGLDVSTNEDKKLLPVQAYGLAVMSIGLLVEEDTPMIWRGPMVHGAIHQMFYDVAWGELDVLVLDMPPGTGDAALSVAQEVPLAGAVIVSTPQDLALLDVRKGVNMFRKAGVPILGLVENMSSFVCPHCGESTDIFGRNGAKDDAEELGIDFLGFLPLTMALREASDRGRPVVTSDPDAASSKAFFEIAERVATALDVVG